MIKRVIAAPFALGLALMLSACQAPSGVQFHADETPEHLSDWHLVDAVDARLELNDGVVPYALNTPLFTDYAHKFRTLWMPKGLSAQYQADAAFDFPIGTILSKTFYYPKTADTQALLRNSDTRHDFIQGRLDLQHVRLIETRLLVHRKHGWDAIDYVWNDAQTDAVLTRIGAVIPLSLHDQRGQTQNVNYIVPDETQCSGCHAPDNKSGAITPIGLKARHINRDYPYPQGAMNQLRYLEKIGYLHGLPSQASIPRNSIWDDPNAPIEQRARAYLDINCGHCHNPKGPANTSGLWLDADNSELMRLGLCKPPVAAGQGTGNHLFDIVPGHPEQSIMMYRLRATDPGVMMPEVGRSMVHQEGVALIQAWIQQWPGQCSDAK